MIGRNSLHLLCACERLCLPHRSITTSAVLAGRKNKLRADPRYKPIKFYNPPHPFDERFYISSKEVSRHKEHGSKWAEKYVEERYPFAPQPAGIKLKGHNHFVGVPEMVPEFIVPDLEGFQLKPYVPFVADPIETPELTPEELFRETYGEELRDMYEKHPKLLENATTEQLLEDAKKALT